MMEENDGRSEPLRVCWDTIDQEFNSRFRKIYSVSATKFHLDVSNVSVDGAKEKWKDVILLDCLLAFSLNQERGKCEGKRRRFDQYTALRESVCIAIGEAWVRRFSERLMSPDPRIQESVFVPPLSVTIYDVRYPWTNILSLRHQFLSQSTSSTWHKRSSIVTSLIDSRPDILSPDGLNNVLNAVVNKFYSIVSLFPLIIILSVWNGVQNLYWVQTFINFE